tara:strand:+ start:7391 stop:8029 length:639 start_codon:yes stop_codon:yes gene_type:complete
MLKTYKQDNMTIHNADCMEVMAQYEDSYFDLAVVDPPYGIGRDGGESGKNWKSYEKKGWDTNTPSQEYFNELFRVSKNQIIWGANYFTQYLPSSMGWIVWDKGQKLTMSDGELAFSSFQKALRIYVCNRCFIGDQGGLLHPTQKPVKLYNWIYANYAEEGQKILDTHLGSGSNAISAHYKKMGEFVGCELDEDYFKASCERIRKETRQLELF